MRYSMDYFEPQECNDPYRLTKDWITYTPKQHSIPGLETFGYYNRKSTTLPIGWHYHENAFEFTIATKGTVSFDTPSANYKFSKDNIFVSFPNEVHSSVEPFAVSEIYWFQLRIDDPESFLFMNKKAAEDMIKGLNTICHHVLRVNSEEVFPLLKQAFYLIHQGKEPAFAATYLQQFLYYVISSVHKDETSLSPDIGRSLNYIAANIAAELTLEELASVANLSCSQYKQKFKRELGVSPRHFINQKKIEQAKTLLLEGVSVTETAMRLGFTTSGYFSTVFKKYTLYSPVEFIKRAQEKTL